MTKPLMPCFSFSRRKKQPSSGKRVSEIEDEISGIRNLRRYTYQELQIACHDFSLANKIGEGGFGSVYKGKLRDGAMVAIKVLSAHSTQGVKEFLAELEVITNIEHENLVKLYGCCAEGKHRILVYGYVENNDLQQILLGRGKSNIQFSWTTRREICIGVARGLKFLHEDVQPHIVHRDIKASNILLDKYLTPKISDFGLAKLFPSDLTHLSTCVAGTIGYLAPEYATRGQLTRKVDVYSFGVLILEIVSGRWHTNTFLPREEQYLVERAWDLYKTGELVALVDPSLEGDFNVDEAQRFLKIGLFCTQDTLKLRPSTSTVLGMLTGEINVDDKHVTEPGILSNFYAIQKKEKQKDTCGFPSVSGKIGKAPPSSTPCMDTSCGSMSFNSIYDRD